MYYQIIRNMGGNWVTYCPMCLYMFRAFQEFALSIESALLSRNSQKACHSISQKVQRLLQKAQSTKSARNLRFLWKAVCKILGVRPVFKHFPALSSDKPPYLSLQMPTAQKFLDLIGASHPSTHVVSQKSPAEGRRPFGRVLPPKGGTKQAAFFSWLDSMCQCSRTAAKSEHSQSCACGKCIVY